MLLLNSAGYIFLIVSLKFSNNNVINTTAEIRYCVYDTELDFSEAVSYARLSSPLITIRNGVFTTKGMILQ